MSDALSLAGQLPATTSRRQILRAAGLSGAAALAMAWGSRMSFGADAPAAPPSGGPTDGASQFAGIPGRNINEKVLNFALTLEILEADLYRQALNIASGNPSNLPLQGNPGFYKRTVGGGGLSPTLTNVGFLYLVQFAYVEAYHRIFLTTAIKGGGGTPVERAPNGYKFPAQPAANIKSLLEAILPLEETGVRAYLGALPYLTDLGLATVAGGIYSTECRHSAAVRGNLGLDYGPAQLPGDKKVTPTYPAANTFEYYLPPKTVVAAVPSFLR